MIRAGKGRSDRPVDVAAYSLENYVADALAVMDATETGQAILVGLSFGGMLACVLAAHHPERVKAAIVVGTSASIGPGYPYDAGDDRRGDGLDAEVADAVPTGGGGWSRPGGPDDRGPSLRNAS